MAELTLLQRLLASPDQCLEHLNHVKAAYSAEEIPAPDGDFPAWEYTASKSFRSRRSVDESGATSLRVVGRVRAAREEDYPHLAVVEVSFRGTKNRENWISNLSADLAPLALDGGPALVHRGFQESYLALRCVMLARISEGLCDLCVSNKQAILAYTTGHSLGGGLATLAAYDLAVSCGYTVRSITFGCPRVGDGDFVDIYTSAVSETVRFVGKLDPVPRLPMNPSDQNDDGAVVGTWMRTALDVVTSKPRQALGMTGYFHVCKGTVLDDQYHSNIVALGLSGAVKGKATSTLLGTHKLKHYASCLLAMSSAATGNDDESDEANRLPPKPPSAALDALARKSTYSFPRFSPLPRECASEASSTMISPPPSAALDTLTSNSSGFLGNFKSLMRVSKTDSGISVPAPTPPAEVPPVITHK